MRTLFLVAPGQIDEGGLKQIGAPGEDKQVENAAEVDFVPGDGQGALLPPMGEAERKAMDNRIDNGQAQVRCNDNDTVLSGIKGVGYSRSVTSCKFSLGKPHFEFFHKNFTIV